MRTTISAVLAMAVVWCTSCGLPPRADATGPERFYSAVLLSHWTENSASMSASQPSYYDASNVATVTWRIGKDAALPRMWEADSHCFVTEGTWRDTEYAPPSHGKTTLTGMGAKPQVFGEGRIAAGLDLDRVLNPGTPFSVVAEGEGLPAFTLSGTLGEELTLTSHPLSTAPKNQLRFSRAEPLTVTWDATSGEVTLLLFQYTPDLNKDYFHMVVCHWAGSPGTATVPVEAMGSLVPSADTSSTRFYFGSLSRQLVTTERADIESLAWHGRGAQVVVE